MKVDNLKKHATFGLLLMAITLFTGCNQKTTNPISETSTSENVISTRIGDLEFTDKFAGGYPTDETAEKLFDEMDFQRACQAYIWSLPMVSLAEWQAAHEDVFKVDNGDIVIYDTYVDKLGILTSNSTTTYVASIVDLTKTGPFVVVEPKGLIGGMILDFWQRLLDDTGIVGPFEGNGGKFLILPPGVEETPEMKGYRVIKSPTNNVFVGWRVIGTDPIENERILNEFDAYAFSERKQKRTPKAVRPDGKKWSQVQPRGMKYWERLSDIINNETVDERDRFFMAMLKPLGIEHGKPFNPNERQKKILEEAVLVGEAMAKTNTFHKRFEGVKYSEDSEWHKIIIAELNQRMNAIDQMDERASYMYEAVTVSKAMQGRIEGLGQAYVGAYKDGEGEWLNGSNSYVLHMPPNPPAKRFWSVTVYDVDTRCMVINDLERPDRSSRSGDLAVNDDGSIDIYFGPTEPEGKQSNWIPTNEGENWFAYVRFYGPEKAYIEGTYPLPNIKKIDK